MPVTIKSRTVNFRETGSDQFVGVDTIAETSTAQQVAAIEAAGAEQIDALEDKGEEIIADWPQDYSTLTNDVSSLKSQTAHTSIALKNEIFDDKDPKQYPTVYLENGGMYGSTGIEFATTARCRTKFIPVTPGETITFVSDLPLDSYHSGNIFEFAYNTKTSSGNNEIIETLGYVAGMNGEYTVGTNTHFIRVQISCPLDDAKGKVAFLHGKRTDWTIQHTYTVTADDITQGVYNGATGWLAPTIKNNISTRQFYHVLPGFTVHFVPGETAAEMCVARRRSPAANFAFSSWITTESDYTLNTEYDIYLMFAKTGHTDSITPEDYDCSATITTSLTINKFKYYSTMDALLHETDLLPGQYVQTLGFHWQGDNGGAMYEVIEKTSVDTADNCVLFESNSSGLYLKRVFTEPWLYLESLNCGNVSSEVLKDAIYRSRIHDIRCGQIITPYTITLLDSDLTFGEIIYTGTDAALVIDSSLKRKIKGDKIYAVSADYGLKMITSTRSCSQNIVEINSIIAGRTGIAIRPTGGNGISHNHYRINYIEASETGFDSYIPANTGFYSYEGEELCTLNQIKVSNNQSTGKAVSFVTDPVNDVTVDGTITGVTFTNLAVEGSDIGIYISCGNRVNTERIDAGVKSIYVNNLRGRESGSTFCFLKGSGYIRDVYVKPTTPIQLCQLDFTTNSGESPCYIDAPIMYGYHLYVFGYGAKFMLGQTYVDRPKVGTCEVTEDIDYSTFDDPMPVYEPGVPWDLPSFWFADRFRIAESLRGQTVTMKMKYFFQDLMDGLQFIIPGASNGSAVTLNVEYVYPHKTITITNTTAETHLYQIDVKPQQRTWSGNYGFTVRDLGVFSGEILVPYGYDEDNV